LYAFRVKLIRIQLVIPSGVVTNESDGGRVKQTEVVEVEVTLTTGDMLVVGGIAAVTAWLVTGWRRRCDALRIAKREFNRGKYELTEYMKLLSRVAGSGELDDSLRDFLFTSYTGFKNSLPRRILSAKEIQIFRDTFTAVDSIFEHLISGRPDGSWLREKATLLNALAERIQRIPNR